VLFTDNDVIDLHMVHHTDILQQANKKIAVENENRIKVIDNHTSSFCLLIKDDNDILNEWIAYHYHTMNMRRIIVAIDPYSETSPHHILDRWKEVFDLHYTLWNDTDYMPQSFLEGNYTGIINYITKQVEIKKGDIVYTTWHGNTKTGNLTQEQIKHDLQVINNHRFRQRTFLSECYRQLKIENRTWTVHIDTDEYITVNPLLIEAAKHVKPKRRAMIAYPETPSAGSLLKFWHDMFRLHVGHIGSKACVLMPSLEFGSRDTISDPPLPDKWDRTSFETLRWNHHGGYASRPKSMVNVGLLPKMHTVFQFGRVFCPHIPLRSSGFKNDCNQISLGPYDITAYSRLPIADEKFSQILAQPLYIQHYLGSLDRYLARKDARRNEQAYSEKASKFDGFQGDGWMTRWFSNFLEEHGEAKVSQVLSDHLFGRQRVIV
jgi:hypothetical protein